MQRASLSLVALLLASTPVHAQQQPTPQQAAAPASEVDAFARSAAEANLSEVLMSAMALQKTNDKRVQDNAWTMLDHHSRAMGELADVLNEGAASLPTEPSAEQQQTLERMRSLQGSQFDQAYLDHQVQAHQRSISLYEQASQLSDEKVANYARVTLPVLRAHQEIVRYRQSQPADPLPAQ